MQKQSMSVDLVEYIKQQILDGQLNPSDRIVETKFAKELGISQTQGSCLRRRVGHTMTLIGSRSEKDGFIIGD
ncbi:hypothetical protein [Paenibacillus luteus]|uniref:hypothetical protein n=1 Tax=Paenibacillus luteus TaxID=2545753 RepID=UPI0011447D77|nr:hypothetical protein [Paenibacillus luteus]